ncbi:Fe-S oxidoreductase [Paramagnetospirillum caucaseum]|uniref:Fe-S oxidoreductase n=1 Tax=Paramagnetospirillum caucaseum TaxID=1244869 RepID=M2ZPV0_9PROT|nr:radical SAM protein [Paramagnetospirillum caucaseum]EME69332.1 Fe-S oxidoreductase [Paramagnetospirillum caucaseum]
MKALIVTTPIRPRPTSTPPFGSLAILNYLRKKGIEDVGFYHIDALRPDFDEAVRHIVAQNPRVLGISAVVSTAFSYTRRLADAVKAALPHCLIVVGGNLAASAEVLLRRSRVDMCATGEGEECFLEVVRRAESTIDPADYTDIPGLVYLNKDGQLVNTGYPPSLPASQIFDICWSDLEGAGTLDIYVYDPLCDGEEEFWLTREPRASQPHRRGKKLATIRCSKGCVARCTFCHRFDKGIRYIPVDLLVARLTELKAHHDVGFFVVGDENFGTDKRWLAEFCAKIKPLDMLWRVSGMRVNCVNPELISMMRDAGCVTLMYGMETGSEKMLQVMEKKVKLADNYNAMEWTVQAGLYTVVQLVVGMPGETTQTIRETIEFCKFAMTLAPHQNPNDLSINYAQALPGTPLYDFARSHGMIAAGLEGEERYLSQISDRDAHDETSTLNFTDQPVLTARTWRSLVTIEVNHAYVAKYGLEHYRKVLLGDTNYFKRQRKRPIDGYFANPKQLVERSLAVDSLHGTQDAMELEGEAPELPSLFGLLRKRNLGLAVICYPELAYRLRRFLPLLVLLKVAGESGLGPTWRLLREWLAVKLGFVSRTQNEGSYRSLRKLVEETASLEGLDSPAMVPLRKGR